ncbi:Oxysterol-binding protein-related protein 6 [Larimichthys crocea]|uniref:Oxysterol-binding protein-related protein 6 n=1 Tax=Larimichthys crocea TaxID=215358 RepID=A0A6G0HWT8_LARCR|nr:Oxysterol-binding protein-related protein 6 [Larimichthys crocea]
MDPQVCPPPLSSSQSVISGLDKSPASGFRPGHSRSNSTGSSKHSKQSRHWEVMDDLQNLDMISVPGSSLDLSIPGICEGYLMKRRKYPLKGWHKRYFLLEKGILKYSKMQQDIQRGKLHGSLDVSLAVMSINKKAKRIDLDAGDNLYHLKAKSHDIFYIWLTKLCAHRVFRKNEAMSVHHGVLHALSMGPSALPAMASLAQKNRAALPHYASSASVFQQEMGSPAPAVASHPGVTNKVSAWLQQTSDIDATSNDLARCQLELTELAQLIQRLHWLEGGLPITSTDLEMRISMQNLSLEKPKKKAGKGIGHSRTLSRVEAMGGFFTSSHLSTNSSAGLGQSLQSIPDYVYSQLSSPQVTSPEAKKLHQDICTASQRAAATLNYRASVNSTADQPSPVPTNTGRRTALPAPGTDNSHIGIMTILYNNIGKDLSRVSMPVALNEPVSLLQRLSEELEYTDLLDIANHIDDPYERMVSHHPPISPATQSPKTSLSGKIRDGKTSFGGSLWRFSSVWLVNVSLPNLATGAQTAAKNEVQGVVLDRAGDVVHRFGGLWHEGIFCDTLPTPKCIWKPNVQPDDQFDFYGFSRYARELNELTPDLEAVLPPTDTRYRPDQRLLEEGKVAEADKKKDEVEETEREKEGDGQKRGGARPQVLQESSG